MRKGNQRLCAFLLALLLCPPPAAEAEELPRDSAAAMIVMNSGGEVVLERGADQRAPIASTTKLMTALVTLGRAGLDEVVEILPAYTGVEGSSVYLQAGERCTVRELLEGLLLASGNDAATALAGYVAGGNEAFADLMNEKARQLGMTGTHFANPHGLDAPEHYGTAHDLARLMAACLREPELMAILGESGAQIGERSFQNHNKLLSLCPGCLGGKTGYTEAAGRCLVSCCERDGTCLICVTLGDAEDWVDHQTLYNWAFERYSVRNVTRSLRFAVPVVSGERPQAALEAAELRLFLPRAAELTLVAHMPRFVFAPLVKGELAGRLEVFCAGEKIGETTLHYAESVGAAE